MKQKNKRIYLSPPHMSGYEQDYLQEAFASNWIAPLGPNVDAFEREITEYAGTKGALALCSGTAAIHLALKLLGVKKGDKVFCSSLTFAASCNPILYEDGIPVFIDSEPESWNMSPDALLRAFSEAEKEESLPKAVIVVNLYGQSADMDVLLEICNRYQVSIIEDAAESLGATYKGKASGTMGKFGVYSFNGNKIITTSGGGMLLSDDLEALEKARFWATQARDKARHYQHSELGYNYRLSNLLAAIGRAQLKVLDERVKVKREIFAKYFQELANIEGIDFMPEPFAKSNRWLTVMTVDDKKYGVTTKQIMDTLENDNIETRPVWKPMHLQPLYKNYTYFSHRLDESISDKLFYNGICLPSGSSMDENDFNRVINCIKKCLK